MLSARVRPLVAGCLVFVAVSACGDQPAAVPGIAGEYWWLGLDNTEPPSCCSTDSDGVVSSVTSGWLDIGTNASPYAYQMTIEKLYVRTNGDSVAQSTVFTSGTYTWRHGTLTLSGDRLTPADSEGSGPITGALYGMLLTIHTRGHEYQFWRPCACPPPL